MQKGFTLIEVLIAVAIIGVMSSIALVGYKSYIVRTQINRVIHEAANFKYPVEVCLSQGQLSLRHDSEGCYLPVIESDLMVGDLPDGQHTSEGKGAPYVSFPLVPTQQIVGYFGNKANSNLKGKKVVWVRSNTGVWSCLTDVDVSYRPTMCSQNI